MKWQAVAWSALAEQGLGDTLDSDRDEIKHDVDTGAATLWRINNGESWTVTRVERDFQDHKELVLVCGCGSKMLACIEDLKKQCKITGIRTMRLHSSRPGMGRFLTPVGFSYLESVYVKKI